MRAFIAISILIAVFSGCLRPEALKPFRTDGCSCFPDGTVKQRDLWRLCCIEHDRAYWMGGTAEERLAADRRLRECVADCGEPLIAELMLQGVRAGGSPYLPTSFRWGFGWPYGRGYRALSDEERNTVRSMLEKKDQ
ncbi:MAG: hypothetical protein JW884_01115 [Deltaproteobacteria bacterium]|nr:hypothetical protein [Deltaproteobacteria bacterium]